MNWKGAQAPTLARGSNSQVKSSRFLLIGWLALYLVWLCEV